MTHVDSPSELPSIARSASIIALGNIASRVLGLARETVKAHLFGASGQVDALNVALILPIQIYELVTGGIINSALVPVFSDYTAPERRAELWRLASTLLTLLALTLAILLGGLEFFTPLAARVVGGGLDAPTLELTAALLRITLPAVLFLSLSGIVSGLLYSLKRFAIPAFTAAVFNAAMVVCALALASRWGVRGMAVGLFAGAVAQLAVQFPALRDARFRIAFNLNHPGLRRIFRLYLPIIFGLLITQASIYIGLNLASRTGEGGIAWMGYATYIYQFPLGLVATAVSFAILPTLSRQAGSENGDFKNTLVQGLNLVIILIVPAAVGLFALARPIVAVLYQRGQFTAADTAQTALVLQLFLLGLSFAAVDQMLIFAFYARKDTLTPSIVGVVSVAVYLITALALIKPFGLFSLMIADSLKQMAHALVTGYLLSRRIGGFWRTPLVPTVFKTLAASALTGLIAALALILINRLALPTNFFTRALAVFIPTALALAVYALTLSRLRVPEFQLLLSSIANRLSRIADR